MNGVKRARCAFCFNPARVLVDATWRKNGVRRVWPACEDGHCFHEHGLFPDEFWEVHGKEVIV